MLTIDSKPMVEGQFKSGHTLGLKDQRPPEMLIATQAGAV
jgi:hypothetical protein